MNSITEFIRTLGVTRLAAMGAVAIGLIGFFAYIMLQMSKDQMSILFSDLPFEDSIAIIKKLEGMNVNHQVKQDGAIILVPKSRVLRLRMQLAEDGLPTGGGVGNEILDQTDKLGTTSEIQKVNIRRALEGELARTIRSLKKIQMARVSLVLPKKRLFSRKRPDPKASIFVKVRGSLESGQIKAIQHLVAAAVEGLNPAKVSIIDDKGKLLASGRGGEDGAVVTELAEERNRKYEQRMQQQIEELIANVVGEGKVRVQVTAEIDYSKTTQTQEIYDPDGQVVRSTKNFSEASSSSQPTGDNGVTVGNELPSAGGNNNNNNSQKENLQKTEEVINYEISKTNKTEIVEAGRVKRISVAVLVDGLYTKDAEGKVTYAPRQQAELDELSQLVRSAAGFDTGRGDKVHVANLRFAEAEAPALDAEEAGFGLSKDDYLYIAEIVVTLLIALLVLLFVIRPLIRRILTPEETIELLPQETIDEQLAIAAGNNGDLEMLQGPDGQPVLDEQGEPIMVEPKSDAVDLIKNAKLAGEIQASFVREVGTLVMNNPQEATAIIRSWIGEAKAEEDEAA